MPRGGVRKGAGKPSSWRSGCKFEDTKLIRVPQEIADRLLELAHSLDEGIDYEIVTNSLLEENRRLKEKLEQNNQENDKQLSLNFDEAFTEDKLNLLRDDALKLLKLGKQSKGYESTKKAFDYFINKLRNSN